MKEYPWGKGTPKWVRDATANDSDKSFTVPTGKVWKLEAVMATLTATATVGNRVLFFTITNGTDIIHTSYATASVVASGRGVLYAASGCGVQAQVGRPPFDSLAAASVGVQDFLPVNMLLPAGYVIRVYDRAAVDAAADDLIVVLHYVEYDA